MVDTANTDKLVFGLGEEIQRCPKTGRAYEVGSGALSREQQTANYVREAARAADMPRDGEQCPQTGRFYEFGSRALTKTAQTKIFLSELLPEDQAAREAAFHKLVAMPTAGAA
jgi:hypothetical protein